MNEKAEYCGRRRGGGGGGGGGRRRRSSSSSSNDHLIARNKVDSSLHTKAHNSETPSSFLQQKQH